MGMMANHESERYLVELWYPNELNGASGRVNKTACAFYAGFFPLNFSKDETDKQTSRWNSIAQHL